MKCILCIYICILYEYACISTIIFVAVDDVSAQTSCVISPNLDNVIIANGLTRHVEFHCQCMDSNGMMITGTRWFHNGSSVTTQNARNSSITAPYQINTTSITLYIKAPFTIDHSHTGTYTCSPNSMSSASPPGDTITLNARSESAYIIIVLCTAIIKYDST